MKKIINFIGSVKFALVVILIIIFLSILGSIVSESSVDKLKHVSFISIFFDPATNDFREFITNIGLINIYTSPLFITLLSLFTLSLVICTIRLIPFARKGFPDLEENALKDTAQTNMDTDEFIEFFNKEGWKVHLNKRPLIKVEHNRPGRYGVIIIHLGIFLVMAGALVDYLFGFKGVLSIFENQTVNGVENKNGEFIPFGFDITLDKFNIEYYNNTYTASAFKSEITVSKDGKVLKHDYIDVNRPLKMNNIYFYQADYGLSPNENMDIYLTYTAGGLKKEEVLKYGKFYQAGSYVIAVSNFTTVYKDENAANKEVVPAIEITVYNMLKQEVAKGMLVLKALEPTYVDFIDMSFHFTDLKGVEYSTISVKYNPGIDIVYLGGVLMCFGVLFIYFLNYTSIIFVVTGGSIRYKVRVHRKLSVVNPADKFYKFIKGDVNGRNNE